MTRASFLVWAVLVGGCNSNNNATDSAVTHDLSMSGAADMTGAPPVDMAGGGGPMTWTVMVGTNGGFSFDPMALTIHAGDTVHWVWAGSGHTVNSGTLNMPDDMF